ncbi:MAG: EamA family transporter [Burkholderiales bacterium]|nr:EamA family transporter [Burkholderiales bacterium]
MTSQTARSLATHLAVPAFIFVWATGYVVAKLAAKDAEALTFLLVRYVCVMLMMGALALAARAQWPTGRQAMHVAVAGVMIQAIYLGGVWVSIRMGLSAGVAALIVNLQPVLTVCLAHWTGERVGGRQVSGVAVGFVGVMIVLYAKLTGATTLALGWPTLICFVALLGTTFGVLYQKRFVPQFDLRAGQAIQFAAATVVTLPFAWAFEHFSIDWTPNVMIAMAWSVFVLSGVGISLMFYLLRTGSVTRLTSTMYVVPGLTAILAWFMFDEQLGSNVVAGMAVTLLGIYLVVAPTRADAKGNDV